MKGEVRTRTRRRDYSGLSITGLAFATMLSVAVVAVGCGDNIGSAGKQNAASSQRSPDHPPQQVAKRINESSDIPTMEQGGTTRVLPEEAGRGVPVGTEPATFESAEAAYNERNYDEAARRFTRYVSENRGNSWGHYMLGLSEWKAGDREAAERAFRQALELDKGHVKSWVNLSRVLLEVERADEALANVDEALAVEEGDNAALRTRGRALEELGRMDEAVASYQQALVSDEEDVWSMNNMGLAFIRTERFDEAVPPLARAVELRSDIPVFFNNLGIALERTGFVADAGKAYAAAVALDSTYLRASENLARVESISIDSLAESADLGLFAVQFADQIVAWQRELAQEAIEAHEAEHAEVEPGVAEELQDDEQPGVATPADGTAPEGAEPEGTPPGTSGGEGEGDGAESAVNKSGQSKPADAAATSSDSTR